ncbi:MAG: GNAT family N-acetyltransferase [Promethearchaeota archaeon]
MKITQVSSNDLNKISLLEKKVFNQNAFSEDLIKKLIRKNLFFLKLEKNKFKKEIIGFVIVVKDRLDRANIINFLINPKYHKKGYGSCLLYDTLQKIKKINDIKKIILNVQVENSNAIKLYHKFGFKIVQKIVQYYQSKEDAYLMELEII